jgi:hypothetical protein
MSHFLATWAPPLFVCQAHETGAGSGSFKLFKQEDRLWMIRDDKSEGSSWEEKPLMTLVSLDSEAHEYVSSVIKIFHKFLG